MLRIFIFLIFTTTIFAQPLKIIPKIGFDFGGKHNVDAEGKFGLIDEKTDNGFNLAIETTYTLRGAFDIGLGIAHFSARNAYETKNLDLSLTPLYAIVKVNIVTIKSVTPQIVSHIGYLFYNTSGEYKNGREGTNGPHIAIGTAVNPVSGLYTEILFSASNFYYNEPNGTQQSEHKIQFTTVSLNIGWIF